MGGTPPKKRRSPRAQGMHRSHLLRSLAKRVNARSPIKVVIGKKARSQSSGPAKTKKT